MRRLTPVFRRAQWVLLDQALSSGTNFIFAVLVARSVSARSFGTFAVAILLYQFALGVSRSMVSEPLVIRFSDAPAEDVVAAGRASAGTALVLGVGAGALLLGTTLAGSGPAGPATAVLALAMPVLFLQDAWRYMFFASRSPARAAFNDFVWLIAQLALFAALARQGELSVGSLTAAWGAAAGVATVVGCIQARVLPAPSRARCWLRDHRRLGLGLTTDGLVRGTAAQLAMLCIGVAGGLTAVGGVRAGLLLFGPLYIILQGSVALAVPEAVRLHGARPDHVLRVGVLSALLLGAVPAVWGAGLLAVPQHFGVALLGDSWAPARALIPALTVMVTAAAVLVPAAVGLRALVAVRRLLLTSLVVEPLNVVFAAAGAFAGGTQGAAVGLAAGNCLMAVGLWWQLVRAVRLNGRKSLVDP